MLPPVGQGGGGRRKGAEAHEYYGPQAVGWHMWLVWIALNSVLYWRYTSPARSLLPLGEKVRLGDDVVVWRSTDANVKVVVPRRADDSAESVWLLTAHNVLHTELVHVEAGYHVSLHPLRLSPLVQITRSSRVAGAVQVRISTHKKRLTTNTFVSPPPLWPGCTGATSRGSHVQKCSHSGLLHQRRSHASGLLGGISGDVGRW